LLKLYFGLRTLPAAFTGTSADSGFYKGQAHFQFQLTGTILIGQGEEIAWPVTQS